MFTTELAPDKPAPIRRSAGGGGLTSLLQAIARLAIAAPRRIIAVALLVMVAAAVFGIPVSKSLSAGGFQDPTVGVGTGCPAVVRQVRIRATCKC